MREGGEGEREMERGGVRERKRGKGGEGGRERESSHQLSAILSGSQGAKKSGKAPDGRSYLDCAESDEIKALLK